MPPGIEMSEFAVLCATAVVIGVGHTILGPDHYVPFVAMSRAGRWSAGRTAAVTVACGLGHVGSSVVIGLMGISAGVALAALEGFESLRGDAAAWLLVAVGIAYAAWGLGQSSRHRVFGDVASTVRAGTPNAGVPPRAVWAPWALFLVFLFGPCEPLIPLLMVPAASVSPLAVGTVAAAYAAATVATMVAAVLALRAGVGVVRAPPLECYGHALAGLAVAGCGLLVVAGL